MKYKEIFKLLSVPLILMGIYLLVALFWKVFNLPSDERMITIIKDYFDRYGLWIVLISALIEGFLLLGQYFPGGFVIFLAVLASGKDVIKVIEVVLVVTIAFFISYTLNYLVGKHGWYRLLIKFGLKQPLEDARQKLIKQGLNAVIFSYWEPNLASITATAAGVLKFPLLNFSFYSAIGIIFWNIFWASVIFFLGDAALQLVGFKYIIIIFSIWIVIILIKKYISDRTREKKV